MTFLKYVMQDAQNAEDVKHYDVSSLRVATFCAEPTSPAVQQFGMYAAHARGTSTRTGPRSTAASCWTHFFGNGDFPLRADAHTYPLPWVMGDVWVADESSLTQLDARRLALADVG